MVEERLVVGKIYTQGMSFDLLDMVPHAPVEFRLRGVMLVFQVADVNGVGKSLYVSEGCFAIIPSEPKVKPITYIVEGEQLAQILDSESVE